MHDSAVATVSILRIAEEEVEEEAEPGEEAVPGEEGAEPAAPEEPGGDASAGATAGSDALPQDAAADFPGFLVTLAAQASALLASVEGSAVDNLAGARHMISILEMLEDKTTGRRTPEEDQLLERLLYELRLGYVQRSKTVSA